MGAEACGAEEWELLGGETWDEDGLTGNAGWRKWENPCCM